ncbi:DNA helicase IV [Vibrio astriarenae]|uniref:DNA 3'-5' helicase n=1 Tax=Vibrio astriarenae TaxID=1481923 RepID=A0A7Z2T8F3_9VIBR|nr:DNA helicase IV [Vibrio astriarenae]QIA66195.1 DNA helicase IV [Vibrio astriarenae]
MQLSASSTARFFAQNEYQHVAIDGTELVISSPLLEERIPFHVWNGNVEVKRGFVWGSLVFYAHPEDEQQTAWCVQGLPWERCRKFAQQAVLCYQEWHNKQCEQLNICLPQWEAELHRLKHLPEFLPHSLVKKWSEQVVSDLTEMNMSLEEAEHHKAQRIEHLSSWLLEAHQQVIERNDAWIAKERPNWEVLFKQIESSPLNETQQHAVLLNDNHNLVLAGAGSGKTSVLTARVAYLLQSHLANAEDILLLAFGRDAVDEMSSRLADKVGLAADAVTVNTFHQLGMRILREVDGEMPKLSPLATDDKLRQAWCIDWLKKHWMTPANFKRWQKHLSNWPIAYLAGDDELGSNVENPKLIAWLDTQLSQLGAMAKNKKDIQELLVSHPEYSRLNSELALVWPCYQAWKQTLKETGEIDFNVMISRATQYVSRGRFKSQWRHIMVDEYQDISPQRLALIEALCHSKHVDAVRLFAVGDDWQSIYQFTGSDVNLTTGFAERFTHSTIHHLDTTYRFNQKIGEVANRFIQANPIQLKKTLNSAKETKQASVFVAPQSRIEHALDELNRHTNKKKSVLILGRNHYHQPEHLSTWQKSFAHLDIRYMTCHASKGKEADYVFVVNVDEGQLPAKVKTLHLDSAVVQSDDDFAHAEERRLFYVALTRAKEKVWVMYKTSPSVFVKELIEDDYEVEVIESRA